MRNFINAVQMLAEEVIDVGAHQRVYVDPTLRQLTHALLTSPRGLRVIDIDGDNFAVGDAMDLCHDDMVHIVSDSGLTYQPRLRKGIYIIQADKDAEGSYHLSHDVRVRVVLSDRRGDPTDDNVAFFYLPTELRRLVRPRKTLGESVTRMEIPSGWRDLSGKPVQVDLKVWRNPLRKELERAIHECFAFAGDSNLRGMAHERDVWLWKSEEATHGGVLRALGLGSDNFDWRNPPPQFAFFKVYGVRWEENSDNPIVVSCSDAQGVKVLQGTVAAKWRAKIINGGTWMVGA